jgi:ubiquitin carboxyl-terminal hydrolase 36/42
MSRAAAERACGFAVRVSCCLPQCRFRLGRQEDSHEFLRCLLDAMHESFLKQFTPKPAPELASTSFVYKIFAGRLRSQIKCEGVNYVSNTYDPFLDLSLEINRASTLQRALAHFTAPEVLDGDNKYRWAGRQGVWASTSTGVLHW